MKARRRDAGPQTRRGVGYTRYSTDEQGSTAEQRAINDAVASEHDIVLVHSFADEGVSRSFADRPGLQELFDYLETHRDVHYLVVNELERLTAGVGQRQQITTVCKRLGITLVTEDIGLIDPHDEDAMYDADVRAVNAKGEVLKVRRRTRRNLRAKVAAGSTIAMRPAYGVRMKPLVVDGVELPSGMPAFIGGRKVRSGELELHPDEYPWLKQIFVWADEGVPSDEIARRLNAHAVPTKTQRSGWGGNTINGILDNPLYKGELVWGRRQVLRDENGKAYLEARAEDDPGRVVMASPLGPLVDPDLWDRVHTERMARRGERRMKKRIVPEHVLDRFVYCARCGHRMYARVDNPGKPNMAVRIRFYCPGTRPGMVAKEGFPGTCKRVNSMLADRIIKGVGSQPIRGGATVRVAVSRGVSKNEHARRRAALEARISEAEAEWKNAKRLAIKGLLDDDDLASTKRRTDEAVSAARAELADLGDSAQIEVLPFAGEIAERFAELTQGLEDESAPIVLRQRLLRDFGVDRIYVDNPDIRVELL
ncbi:recombinase family protein [Nocardioides sp. NPDC057772]|uniref:recombinase family protein n=1 Tax=Nocardioides sp. NPDC057772 TaxID=3346245 RepID=UPI00366D3C09